MRYKKTQQVSSKNKRSTFAFIKETEVVKKNSRAEKLNTWDKEWIGELRKQNRPDERKKLVILKTEIYKWLRWKNRENWELKNERLWEISDSIRKTNIRTEREGVREPIQTNNGNVPNLWRDRKESWLAPRFLAWASSVPLTLPGGSV